MHDDDAVRPGDLAAVCLYLWWRGGFPGDLAGMQDGIEPFGIEVVEEGVMPPQLQDLHGGVRDGMIETPGRRMGKDH
jgi:hypothetical protein